MAEQPTGTRKRKQAATALSKDSRADEIDAAKSGAHAASRGGIVQRMLWVTLLSALAFAVYKNSPAVRRYAGIWLGVQDDAVELHGTRRADFIGFEADVPRRDAVVEAFKHAWSAYERDAMGADEYHPISRNGSDLTPAGGIGYTVVDSLDTMLLMGLADEYARARAWVATNMTFERDASFNTFETTIRVLGGLLSAYHLSGEDALFLDKAKELADRLLPAFDTPSGLPLSMINLAKREGISDKDNQGLVSTAEASTLQLEFRYLAHLTDEDIYWRKAERVMAVIRAGRMPPGLASIFMNPNDGRFVTSAIRLGSRGDSYYEYLLKQYVQTDLTEGVYRDMYDDAVQAIHDHLIQKSMTSGLTYTSELIPERDPTGQISWRLTPKQDFLVCFFGGTLMLGATRTGAVAHPVSVPPRVEELSETGRRDWHTGVELIRTCMNTHDTQTGLAPEIAYFRIPSDDVGSVLPNAPRDWYIKGARRGAFPPYDARYILRPETVESLFVAFRLTGDRRYREWGWRIFQSIQTHCRIPTGGYAAIVNVDEVPVRHEDKMETFLMSETLKYLFLLFSDGDVIPLDKYVFNTEAHPLPIFTPTIRTGFT
ncbi:glycoside hydrolase family 47 protein [Heterobasidion irregulare TC 32-1]|uniref:alpha-1,2-Mannosidase n=1 Tax=Heterobasidion irregulare (strain TC 32-1) TaxID=747525 RepID=W4KL55_HETIT|nr:glycoside hydrolase family 47 protein [Heterobasidion irregulare TC 32-1]ETW86588.1 glycoside hydrolase family 47 protein [Heterobasidion irregulare TC 32-1]